jgi:hypothetical protein
MFVVVLEAELEHGDRREVVVVGFNEVVAIETLAVVVVVTELVRDFVVVRV